MSEPPAAAPAVPAPVPDPALQEDEMSTLTPAAPVADWEDEPMPGRPRRRLLTPVTALLAALLLGGVGFMVGVAVEKNQLPAASAAGTGRRAGGGGAGAGAGAAAGATIGTVASIAPPNLYVTDTQGNTIKVVTSPASTITRQVAATARGVHPGDAVVVAGPKAADGSVIATTVRDSGAGGGGLAGLFGGGGRRAGAGAAAGATGAAAGGAAGATGAAAGGAAGGGAAGGTPSLFGG